MGDPWHWLEERRADVAARGLGRRLRATPSGLVDLASNDYLGLSRHPSVVAAAASAAALYGAGSTGSRLVTGTHELHLSLEQALSDRLGGHALVLSSGYLANLAAVSALTDADTLVVSDRRNHASLIDACRLSRASVRVTDSIAEVAAALDSWPGRAVVVTDAVFSTDGSLAPLADLHTLVRRHGALLLVDEAHAIGALGPSGEGACFLAGIADELDVVRTITLSKSLASQGGAILGTAALREHLIDTARPFMFDTALAPPSVGAALAALSLMTPDRVAALTAVGTQVSSLLDVDATPGPIVCVPVPDPRRAVAAQQRCLDEGVLVGCFRPPSVPVDGSCLRLTARADLAPESVEQAVAVVRAAVST
ncbi:MAG: 8-amino-7-oxononanoate synthase [Frankiales bacterium]|nr:8-amino-7-oxononanoate synthase [Frankiales bacterium]